MRVSQISHLQAQSVLSGDAFDQSLGTMGSHVVTQESVDQMDLRKVAVMADQKVKECDAADPARDQQRQTRVGFGQLRENLEVGLEYLFNAQL